MVTSSISASNSSGSIASSSASQHSQNVNRIHSESASDTISRESSSSIFETIENYILAFFEWITSFFSCSDEEPINTDNSSSTIPEVINYENLIEPFSIEIRQDNCDEFKDLLTKELSKLWQFTDENAAKTTIDILESINPILNVKENVITASLKIDVNDNRNQTLAIEFQTIHKSAKDVPSWSSISLSNLLYRFFDHSNRDLIASGGPTGNDVIKSWIRFIVRERPF